MGDVMEIKTPLDEQTCRNLSAGQQVLISGTVYSARDAAHKILCQALDDGEKLPFDLNGAVIYFVGPTPAKPGSIIGSAGPTTSSRMDAFTPKLISAGLRATIGKGYRSRQVRDALSDFGAVHFSAIGGAGALLSKHIVSSELIAYEHLGTEAIRRMEFCDFPVVVAYDSRGKSVYND